MTPQMGEVTTIDVAAFIAAHAANYALHTKVVLKTADQTVNNSDTLQDDDEVLIPVLADEIWLVEVTFLYNSGATPDIKVSFSVPARATILWGRPIDTPFRKAAGETWPFTATGADEGGKVIGIVTVGDTAGDVVFRWAQNNADVSDTKVLAGSCLVAHQLA